MSVGGGGGCHRGGFEAEGVPAALQVDGVGLALPVTPTGPAHELESDGRADGAKEEAPQVLEAEARHAFAVHLGENVAREDLPAVFGGAARGEGGDGAVAVVVGGLLLLAEHDAHAAEALGAVENKGPNKIALV